MFISFFPRPRLFFLSALLWTVICVAVWYGFGAHIGAWFGVPLVPPDADAAIGLPYFITPDFLFFYAYVLVGFLIFFAVWCFISPYPFQMWSIAGSVLIIFSEYYSVHVSVAINAWYKQFYDLIQEALEKKGSVDGVDAPS